MKCGSVIFEDILRDGKWHFVIKSTEFTADIDDVDFCLNALPQELYNASKESSVPILGLFIAREFTRLQGRKVYF